MSAKSQYPLQWQAIALPFEPDTWARPIGRQADADAMQELNNSAFTGLASSPLSGPRTTC